MAAVSEQAPTELPTFAYPELKVGRVIGKGGFSVVSEILGIRLDEVYDTSETGTALRQEFAKLAKTANSSTQQSISRYVVKSLRTDLPEEEHAKGVVDLAIEAEFLSRLAHPNIIAMRATANSDPHESKYFVILDRLTLTLDRKINFWRKEVSDNVGFWLGPGCGYCCSKKHVLHRLWMERLMVARDVATAIRYLHAQGIVYRDLKPDNIGFDQSGEVKLFDFGLAKHLDPQDKSDNELYMLTGNTGSLRYMAPEVALCEPYDNRVDAYSFGILFWQICSLTTPYMGYSTKMHADRVIRGGYRPKPDASWPTSWVGLMKDAWGRDLAGRPSFDTIVQILDAEVTELLREEGVVPSRYNEIKAKKKKKKKGKAGEHESLRLDVDTRISSPDNDDDGPTIKKHDESIV